MAEKVCEKCGHVTSGDDAKSVTATHARHLKKKYPAKKAKA